MDMRPSITNSSGEYSKRSCTLGQEWVDGVVGKATDWLGGIETMPNETLRGEGCSQRTCTVTWKEGPGADSKLQFGFCSQKPRGESP